MTKKRKVLEKKENIKLKEKKVKCSRFHRDNEKKGQRHGGV